MLYRKELCDLHTVAEGHLLTDIVGSCLFKSEHTLRGGLSSQQYFDIDNFILKKDAGEELATLLAGKIQMIELEENVSFTKIAFIDKPEGPINLIPLISSISHKSNKQPIIIRLNRHLILNSIKGTLVPDDVVLILSDVGTTGGSIFDAVARIWSFHAKVPCALVIFDRLQGATENLGRKGIQLFSLTSSESFINVKTKDLHQKYRKKIDKSQKMSFIDFRNRQATSVL